MNEEAPQTILDSDLFEITESIVSGRMSMEQAIADQKALKIRQLKAEAREGRVNQVAMTFELIEIERRFKFFFDSLMNN